MNINININTNIKYKYHCDNIAVFYKFLEIGLYLLLPLTNILTIPNDTIYLSLI